VSAIYLDGKNLHSASDFGATRSLSSHKISHRYCTDGRGLFIGEFYDQWSKKMFSLVQLSGKRIADFRSAGHEATL